MHWIVVASIVFLAFVLFILVVKLRIVMHKPYIGISKYTHAEGYYDMKSNGYPTAEGYYNTGNDETVDIKGKVREYYE